MLGTSFRLFNKRLLVVALFALMLLLVACGGGEATDESASAETGTDSPYNGLFQVAMQPAVNLDPLNVSSDSEVLIVNHVYDYLIDIDAQNNLKPRLAESFEASEDGLTFTVTLRDGVVFHDGSPLTAEDVVWTYERLRDTEGAPTADLYSNITDISAEDDSTVVFTLAEPNPFFGYDLSDNHALILKAGTEDAATAFNGTGPFKVANYSPEDRIELVANEDYFIDGQPKLAAIDIIFFNDDAAAVDALRGGQIDLVMRMSAAQYDTLQGEDGISTIDIPTNGFDLVRLRADRAPGDDPRVMQALRLATDREAIFNVVQNGRGAIGNDTPIGPLYEAYHDPDITPPARDVEAARALLEEAGYGDGLSMTLNTPDTGGRPDLAAVLAEQWSEAGIDIEINVQPESVYYGDDGWLEVDLGITGWGSRPYPQFYFDTMLVSDAIWNEAHFSDAEFDALAETAGTTMDEAERVEAYQQAQQLLVDRGPVLIPYYFAQLGAYDTQFENFVMKAFAGRTDFRNVTYTGE